MTERPWKVTVKKSKIPRTGTWIPLLFFLMIISPSFAKASPIIISDPFPGVNGDTIGNRSDFDIQSASVDLSVSTQSLYVELYFNYRDPAISTSGNTISPYIYDGSFTLNSGDILFASGGEWKYGISLSAHGGSPNGGPYSVGAELQKGGMYRIVGDGGVLTAFDVLQSTAYNYRRGEYVWLFDQDGSSNYLDLIGSDYFNIGTYGDGTASAEYLVQVSVPVTQEFIDDFSTGLSFQFASATCGNDVIKGNVQQVPEGALSFMILIASGYAGLFGFQRRRSGKE